MDEPADEPTPPGGPPPGEAEPDAPLPDGGQGLPDGAAGLPDGADPPDGGVDGACPGEGGPSWDDRVPEEWEIEGPAVSISLGDAADLDPALLAAICGPDGLGGALGPQFGQDQAADALRPGPVLAALTEQAITDVGALTDDQLMGVLQAARRLENRVNWQQTVAVAEFARRRDAQLADARARKAPAGQRRGEFPADELAAELLITRNQAAYRIDAGRELAGRLPSTLAGMAAGAISAGRACTIAYYTQSLSDADAALADQILAAAAPALREDTLARRAAALEMRLDPDAARVRKEHARDTRQRVEARRELSGNASLSGRELDTADVMASKAHISALALRLRRAGLDGPLDTLRARVMADLTSGRNPFDRITPPPANPDPDPDPAPAPDDITPPPDDAAPGDITPPPDSAAPDSAAPDAAAGSARAPEEGRDDDDEPRDDDGWSRDDSDSWSQDQAWDDTDDEPGGQERTDSRDGTGSQGGTGGPNMRSSPASCGAPAPAVTPASPGKPASFPAVINLIVPIGTLLGWSTAPSQAGTWGLLDPIDTKNIVAAASTDPRTRWCMTITGQDGTALAHGCSAGQHPWQPESHPDSPAIAPPGSPPRTPPKRTQPEPRTPDPGPGPDAAQAGQLRDLLRHLKIPLEPIARKICDHRHAEDRYTPSRKLSHLIGARTNTCDAPGCAAQAIYADLDHTTPHPHGPTDECNLGPKCRRHHRAKQAPGWHLEQPQPGIMRWTLPSGRTHTTTPTIYDT